ncbi:MAG: hypothetical protein L0323_23640 [Planctomycetes bacterium]|nr:hypothetical protein [Planctomycetota bacterium]
MTQFEARGAAAPQNAGTITEVYWSSAFSPLWAGRPLLVTADQGAGNEFPGPSPVRFEWRGGGPAPEDDLRSWLGDIPRLRTGWLRENPF